jgi:tetratricopeptide (TPR) repeat protein
MQDYPKAVSSLKKLIEIKKDPKEILLLIRILQNKLKNIQEAIQYIDILIDYIKNFPVDTKNPYLQVASLKKRKEKLLALYEPKPGH